MKKSWKVRIREKSKGVVAGRDVQLLVADESLKKARRYVESVISEPLSKVRNFGWARPHDLPHYIQQIREDGGEVVSVSSGKMDVAIDWRDSLDAVTNAMGLVEGSFWAGEQRRMIRQMDAINEAKRLADEEGIKPLLDASQSMQDVRRYSIARVVNEMFKLQRGDEADMGSPGWGFPLPKSRAGSEFVAGSDDDEEAQLRSMRNFVMTVYGDGGFNRWRIFYDGRVQFSRSHCSSNDQKFMAALLGFEIYELG